MINLTEWTTKCVSIRESVYLLTIITFRQREGWRLEATQNDLQQREYKYAANGVRDNNIVGSSVVDRQTKQDFRNLSLFDE